MNLCDAHCHLANLSDLYPVDCLLSEAKERSISCFLSSALRKCEIEYHLQNPDPFIKFSAGIHPNFDECDITIDDLEELARRHRIHAIGECGLDRGNPDLQSQVEILERQLSLAERYDLPVILHLVGHLHIAVPLLKRYPLTYLVHGYAGSIEGFKQLSELDTYFTISSRICKPDKTDLLKAIIHKGRYLFETDITQYYVKEEETNPLLRLLVVIDKTANLNGVKRSQLIETQWKNYCILFGGGDA